MDFTLAPQAATPTSTARCALAECLLRNPDLTAHSQPVVFDPVGVGASRYRKASADGIVSLFVSQAAVHSDCP